MNSSFQLQPSNEYGLYVITIEAPGRTHEEVADAAIKGGASAIQYRDKNVSSKKMFDCAKRLRELTKIAGVKLIINDRVDIALAVDADGVHLGQDDLPLEAARRIMGNEKVIGISATCLEEAVAAADGGADYIGLGPIYPTPSKEDAAPPIGIEGLVAVRKAVSIPIVSIGGITIDNVDDVTAAGSDGVAVISAVASAPDMVESARAISEKVAR